jgi:glutathionylspermidine synthase
MMLTLQKVNPIDDKSLEELGFTWHTDSDGTKYVSDELLHVSDEEAEAYYEAANTIYDMYVQAAEFVIDNDLFFELGIPFNLIESIKKKLGK